ncbi:MAG: hypothetical protein ACM3NQ_01510, partial [Bacteroidales bacterium]
QPSPSAQQPKTSAPTVAPAPSQESARSFGPNVRVEVTITDQGGTSSAPIRKTISLTAASSVNRTSNSVRSGVNVPVPQTTMSPAATGAPGTIPITTYSYRTMGLSLDLREVEVRENQVRLGLTVEYSPLDESEKPKELATTPVSYSNFSQSFQLVLDSGKPIVAAETSDPVPNRSRKLSVEVKATILR